MHPIRRFLIPLALFAVLAGLSGMAAAEDYPPFNTRIGTQTFSPTYAFSPSETRLVETAREAYEMGSDVIKFGLMSTAPDSYKLPPLSTYGITTLTDMARDEPSVRKVLDMPFRNYVLWAYPLTVPGSPYHPWRNGLSASESQNNYNELYNLTRYLLTTYNGSGKRFFLGHWEGDWALLGNYDTSQDPTPTAIQGMIDWYTIRQKAVDDARAATPHAGVEVYLYSEVNLVAKAMQGKPTVTNSVLTQVRVDTVSYSSYDTIFGNTQTFINALNYLETTAQPKGDLDRNVFVGEFGFPLFDKNSAGDLTSRGLTPDGQASETDRICKAAAGWGCPFVLYWEMYDNEADADGERARGFWMINNRDEKQPVYFRYQAFYNHLNAFKNFYRFWLGRNPDESAVRAISGAWDTFSFSDFLTSLVNSAEFKGRVDDAAFVGFLLGRLYGVSDPATDADYAGLAVQLGSGTPRSEIIDTLLDSARFAQKCSDSQFARILVQGALRLRPDSDEGRQVIDELAGRLGQGESRSAVWRGLLGDDRFLGVEMSLRRIDGVNAPEIDRRMFPDLAIVDASLQSRALSWVAYQ